MHIHWNNLNTYNPHKFNNAKIGRWQEDISCYKFILEFVEGESNVWADLHHPHWEDLQPPRYRSRADEGRCFLESSDSLDEIPMTTEQYF